MEFGLILSIEIIESTRKHRKDRMVKIFRKKYSKTAIAFVKIAPGSYADGLAFHFIGQLTKAFDKFMHENMCRKDSWLPLPMQHKYRAATAIAAKRIGSKRGKNGKEACKCTLYTTTAITLLLLLLSSMLPFQKTHNNTNA